MYCLGGIDVPAMLSDSVLSVSALKLPTGADPATAKLERAGFSNYGKNSVDVAAPGQRIWSTMPTWEKDPPFGYLSGTSMASPHAAGVAALVKEIHPDYTADEVIALVKKQAGYTYDRLAEPTDGKEYRGAGLVNALDAVLKDQPKPVMGSVEYSYDGGTDWRPLADAHVAGMIYVRTTVTGPVTTATMKVEDQDPVTVEGTGEFTGNQVVLLGGPYDTSKLPADEPFASVTVTAEGRNKDERADDDVADAVHFHVDASAHEGGAWVNDPAGWKYCYKDSTCAKGPLAIGADSYYFDENGILGTGWVSYDGAWHWLGTSGRIATGWTKVADAWYYMDNSGAMTTGWRQVRGSWFYLADSGKMAMGWTKIGDSWYYFQESGAMATGWVNDGGTWYYLNESGQMVTGRVQIDGTWYTFDKSGALRR